jgi:acetoin utilization deacetylase AcuC-like enzyme
MVLYDPGSHISLGDYGILIPVAPDRAARVFSELENRLSDTGVSREQWVTPVVPTEITRQDILRVHSPDYVRRLYGPELESVILEVFELIDEEGRPFRYAPENAQKPMRELFDSVLRWSSRSYQAGLAALEGEARYCYHLGGGAHHGHFAFGHGFCVINDIVVSLRKLQSERGVRKAWVIDLDAHKGDGTAALTADDERIVTVSIHMATGWPLDLPEIGPDGLAHPSFVASDYDIPVASGEESEYLPRLAAVLDALGERALPDIAYVVGGVDPYEHDELPSTQGLRLSLEQLVERDRLVFEFLYDRGIPQAWLMAGGYGVRAWEPYVPSIEHAIRTILERRAQDRP